MKKRCILITIVLLLLLTACSNNKLSNIKVNELKEKTDNKESFVLYLSANDNELESTLNQIVNEYDFNAYKINLDKLSDEEKLELKTKYAYSDPSIIFIIDGKDPTILSHITNNNITKKAIVERLKDMNFIKE